MRETGKSHGRMMVTWEHGKDGAVRNKMAREVRCTVLKASFNLILKVFFSYYFARLMGRSIVMTTVCMFVCLSARISQKPRSRTLPTIMHVTYGRGSVLLGRRCDTSCASGFVDVFTQWTPRCVKFIPKCRNVTAENILHWFQPNFSEQ